MNTENHVTCDTDISTIVKCLVSQCCCYQQTLWVIGRLLRTLVEIYTPSIYSSPRPLFLFIPTTRLHQMMFCCQATDRRVSPSFLLLPLFSVSLPSALWLSWLLCSFFFLLPSPIEVSALPTCTQNEFWQGCVSLHTLWYVQMAWNDLEEPSKKRMKRKFLGEKDWTWKAAKCTS